MSFFPLVSADELFASSGFSEYEGSDGCDDVTEVMNLLKTTRSVSLSVLCCPASIRLSLVSKSTILNGL